MSEEPLGNFPATECICVVSKLSASESGGRMPGNRLAIMDLPLPGGPIRITLCPPAAPNAARARAISIDGETTAIEDIEWGDGNPFIAPTDNRIYNLEGQMVGTNLEQLPKGLYIVNGKKVIK